jgi:hypothetical protein
MKAIKTAAQVTAMSQGKKNSPLPLLYATRFFVFVHLKIDL